MTGDYTIKDVAKVLGIDRGRAADWLSRGYIKPSEPSTQQGVASRFSRQDIIMAALFKKLVDRGFDRDQAERHVSHLVTGRHNIDNIHFAFFGIVPDSSKKNGYRVLSWYDDRKWEDIKVEVPQDELQETIQMDKLNKWYDKFDMIITLNFKMVRDGIDKELQEL